MRRSAGDRVSLGYIRAVEVLKHHETDLAFIIWTRLASPTQAAPAFRGYVERTAERRYADPKKKRRSPEGTALVVKS